MRVRRLALDAQVGMEGMLKQGLAPVYSFADRSVSMGVRPEHYEVIAEVLPIALEVRQATEPFSPELDVSVLTCGVRILVSSLSFTHSGGCGECGDEPIRGCRGGRSIASR